MFIDSENVRAVKQILNCLPETTKDARLKHGRNNFRAEWELQP
jgi:hypothetical protein